MEKAVETLEQQIQALTNATTEKTVDARQEIPKYIQDALKRRTK